MVTPLCFSSIFTKGNNFCDFLFASIDGIALPKWGLFLKERIFSKRSNFFPLRVNPS